MTKNDPSPDPGGNPPADAPGSPTGEPNPGESTLQEELSGESASGAVDSHRGAGESTSGASESTFQVGGSHIRAGESAPPAEAPGVAADRRAELAANLAAVRERIAAACAIAHRDPSEIRLLTVTKTFPATDVALLRDLGLADFAENRDTEAAAKVTALAALRPDHPARWTMVGRLQRNKARSVAQWAAEAQSVDSGRLADALQHAVSTSLERGNRSDQLDVLIQVSIDGDSARGGIPLGELFALSDHIAGLDALRLLGVMAVAPLGMPPEQAFDRLTAAVARLRTDHPSATCLSLGMSGDLEQAITHGSTCVRVGTALLGGRRLASP